MKTSGSLQDFERELLGSARADAVPEGARERVAARLGLGAGAVGVALVTTSNRSLPKPALLGVAGAGVLGLVLWSAAPATIARPVEPMDVAPAATAVSAIVAVAAPAVPSPPSEIVMAESHEPPSSPAPGRAVRTKIKPRASAAAPAVTTTAREATRSSEGLLEEVKQLDRARADLGAERASLGLAVLDDYARRFPSGQLALEASVLRASALAANGRGDEARALAQRLLAQKGSARYRAELEPIAGYDRRAGDIEGAR
jgi:hypothetical protein